MQLYYQGKDITNYVKIRSCIARDSSGERCDSLKIQFENASSWYRWGPEEDDQIRITHNDYDSGTLYLNTIRPQDGKYSIVATSLPCKARRKENRSFAGKTLEQIMRACAAGSGMNFGIYGISGSAEIPYIHQESESAAAFLNRLLRLEGAALKCINGKYAAIGILYAQRQNAALTVEITAKNESASYQRSGETIKALTIRTPYAEATATDKDVPGNHIRIVRNDIPARSDIQAGRWARGLLLSKNRECETVKVASGFNSNFTAMTRVDVSGGTAADGEWLIKEAEHDFINLTSTALMHRCVTSIQ